jgi:leucyl/phenylalanyl-tRNA--protein transferase
MPFFQLSKDDTSFPPAHFADMEGMIAIGGDLSPERVINAYTNGIFFLFGPMDPIKWWSPDPRIVLFTNDVERAGGEVTVEYRFSMDEAFEEMLRACQAHQNEQPMNERWITEEMVQLYMELHQEGYAHSAEVWLEDELIGGLFGISSGRIFFAEYILDHDPVADVYALEELAVWLHGHGFSFIELEKIIENLGPIEISEISRLEFLDYINKNKSNPALSIPWVYEEE